MFVDNIVEILADLGGWGIELAPASVGLPGKLIGMSWYIAGTPRNNELA